MNYRVVLMISAIISTLIGALFLILPKVALAQFGAEDYVSVIMMARFLGYALVTQGLLAWFVKDVFDQVTQRGVEMAMLASSAIGFILTVLSVATSTAVLRQNSWILLTLFLVSGLIYAFMLFFIPQQSGSPAYRKEV